MTQAEQPSRVYRRLLALAAILMVAFALRLLGLGWGLPNSQHYFSYHPDEIFLLLPSFGLAQGDWNPHFFNYGTLYIYLVGLPALLLHVVPEAAQFPENLRALYELGRGITLGMGIATIALLFAACGPRQWRLGLLAAALLAVCPLDAVNSAYATVDVPTAFWLTLAFLLAIRGAGQPTGRQAALVGLASGLAGATKYNAGLFIIPAILAPVLVQPRTWRWSWAAGVIGGAILGFALGCPFFWTEEFRRGLLFEVRHAQVGGTLAFVNTGNGWSYHLLRGLPTGLGYPMLAALVLGIVGAVRLRWLPGRISLLWCALYLVVIGFGKERFIRYLVLLLPFAAVLAAAGLGWLASLARSARSLLGVGAIMAGIVGLTGLYAFEQTAPSALLDPRDYAWSQAESDVLAARPQARVGLLEAPWYRDPPASPYNAGQFSRAMFEHWNRANGGRVVTTGWDTRALEAQKPDVFFLSDLESQDPVRLRRPEAIAFVSALDGIYKDKIVFGRPDQAFSWLAPPRSWAPPDWLYQSPIITMYYNPR
jgi:hypothetical protein